jgi:glyoxylase-like metal-dependent hydrolase (beta-lactamase superfamily II)
VKLYSVNAGYFKLDGGAMFGVVPKSIWNNLNPADENNMCNWAMRCLLIEDEGKLILIDTGIGNKQSEKFFSHYYLNGTDTLEKSLAKYGFAKDDVTDVFLTHLHFDHCGGAIEKIDNQLVPAFKNATYWSNEKHWEWATNPNDREKASFLKENILPIRESGKLKMVEIEEGVEFIKNFNIRFVNGHTGFMMLPQIRYKDRTIVYVADLLPSISHIGLPYIMSYDTRPLETLKEKKSFLDEASQNDFILFFEHDPAVECCTVQRADRGIHSKQTFKLESIF